MKKRMLEVNDLTVRAPGPTGGKILVDGIDLVIRQGGLFTLIGETGSGKSIVAQALTGTLPEELSPSGRVCFDGVDILRLSAHERRSLWGRKLFLLPQEPERALDPTMKVAAQVEEIFKVLRYSSRRKAREETRRLFARLGLSASNEGRRYPCQLSGGMNQRVLFAMALASPANFIVADEPTKGLDPLLKRRVTDLLGELNRLGKTVFCITHDLLVARRLGGNLAVMFRTRIVEKGPAEIVLERPSHPYTQGLFQALPENGLHPIPARMLQEMQGV